MKAKFPGKQTFTLYSYKLLDVKKMRNLNGNSEKIGKVSMYRAYVKESVSKTQYTFPRLLFHKVVKKTFGGFVNLNGLPT